MKIYKVTVIFLILLVLPFAVIAQSDLNMQLLKAVKQNDSVTVQLLLNLGADVNSCDTNGASVLMWAAYKSDLDMVKYLVDYGADYKKKWVIYLENQGGYYGNLTGMAAGEGKLNVLKFFIEECKVPVDDKEWNPYDKAETGWTALQWACYKSSLKIAK